MGIKRMHKLELICVKYILILIALKELIDVVLSYFDIYIDEFNFIAGVSFITLVPMYISSYTYKFCAYHRMFINYILTHKIIVITDHYIGIPVEDTVLLALYLTVAGVFAFITLHYI